MQQFHGCPSFFCNDVHTRWQAHDVGKLYHGPCPAGTIPAMHEQRMPSVLLGGQKESCHSRYKNLTGTQTMRGT